MRSAELQAPDAVRLARSDWLFLALALPVLVFVLRAPTFLYHVIDGDESVYLVIARSILQGHLPYTAVWDNKPPGIFFLFAMGAAIFGVNVESIRLLACLAVVGTGAAIYLLVRRLTAAMLPAAFAAVVYALTSLGYGGRASNTEIFIALPVAWAFQRMAGALLDASGPRAFFWRYLLVGSLLGAAIQIKTVAVFDAAAVALITTVAIWFRPAALRPRLANLLAAGVGTALGIGLWFAIIVGAYAATGHLPEYVRANLTVNRAYASGPFVWRYLSEAIHDRLREDLLPWLIIPVSAVLVAFGSWASLASRRAGAAALIWFGCTSVAVASTGKFFGHYFLQLLPPLSVLAGLAVQEASVRWAERPRTLYAVLALALAIPGVQVFLRPLKGDARVAYQRYWKGDRFYQDTPGALADYLSPRLPPGGRIYACEAEPVVYILAHAEPSTRYVFAGYLTHEFFSQVASVDGLSELREMMRDPPAYVLLPTGRLTALPEPRFFWEVRNPAYFQELGRYLRDDYVMETSIGGVDVYRHDVGLQNNGHRKG
jgi:4-amino-4-deoxy-L-arabinose transferase-like glycosyltransferase